jgi:hypothetical protein
MMRTHGSHYEDRTAEWDGLWMRFEPTVAALTHPVVYALAHSRIAEYAE